MRREQRIDKFVNHLQPDVKYCYNCQARDSGEWVWVLGHRADMEDLLDKYDVPEELRDEVADKLSCENCGTQLSRWAEIGLETEEEKEFHEKIGKWQRYYEKDFLDFLSFIEKYPFLGGQHKIGALINKTIKQFPETEIKDEVWCRARKIVSGSKLTSKDMLPPDPSERSVPEGRYNHFGQSHFYLANNPQAAAKEVLEDKQESLVYIQKVRIIKASKILDLRNWWGAHDNGLSAIPMGMILSDIFQKNVDRNKHWKPEYFITRYIADVAKLNGYNGIIFQSNHHYYNNMVIFKTESIKYEFIKEPSIYELKEDKINDVLNLPTDAFKGLEL